MQIENDLKLDFSDVLLRPKRSILTSRKEVILTREFQFRNSKRVYQGVPIMAANMDGVGTLSVTQSLAEQKLFTCLTKHIDLDILVDWIKNKGSNIQGSWAYSMGITKTDVDKLDYLINKLGFEAIKYICIDVANGYTENFVNFIRKIRSAFPTVAIIAGNVVTAEMTEQLLLGGADIVKVGIGPGCFAPGQLVITETGPKSIENIQIGEKVLTHTGQYQSVTNTFTFNDKKSIMNINGIKATDNHEFYVLHKKYRDVVNENNIQEYAEWIAAKDITKNHLLIKHK